MRPPHRLCPRLMTGTAALLSALFSTAIGIDAAGSRAAAQGSHAHVRAELAPTGKLRIALFPLPQIAVRATDAGPYSGVVIDLTAKLAERLNVPVEVVIANSPAAAVEQVKSGQADLTYLVDLPARSALIDFGAAYIEYETTFLVPANSPIRTIAQVNAPGRQIVAPEKSEIETRLKQQFKDVTVVGVPIAIGTTSKVIEMLSRGEVDAYSNLTHLLSITQASLPGSRLVPGSYMMTVFSVGYPKERPAAASYINQFISEMKRSGFIQSSIERSSLKGAIVAK